MNKKIEIIKRLRAITSKDQSFGTIHQILIKLNTIIAEGDFDLKLIADLISRDALLTMTILKAANSSVFASVKKISTVPQSVAILGLSNVQKILTSAMMVDEFKITSHKHLTDLWHHSIGTAVAAQCICKYTDPKIAETMFTVGLLHDVGSFILYRYFPNETVQILEELSRDPNKRLILAEKKVLGLTHQDIGAFFAREWNFPDYLQECIKHHHYVDTDLKSKNMAAIIQFANNIVKALEIGKSDNYYVEPLPKWIWGVIRIPDMEFLNLSQTIREEFEKNLAMF